MKTPVPTTCPYRARALCSAIASFIMFLLFYTSGKAQSVWTWKSGDNTTNQAGVYGTKGVAAAANKHGARDSYSTWTDASGNFWFFGGIDNSNKSYNDLWKYNPGTGQWTWVSGDNTTNTTGVYGTKGTATATNKPGARYGQTAWSDASGNFWIFGGYGFDATGNGGPLNDLWKFNPTNGLWTWVSGDNSRNSTGVYGTKGTAAAANKPGGRYYLAGWKDGSGNFWIYGGNGYNATGSGLLNDLWKYDPATGLWTWVSGDNSVNAAGVYGTKGTAAAANKPGGRSSHSGWGGGASGNIWIWGGNGIDATGNTGYENDLWKYNTGTGQWTWVSGDNTRNISGVYGTKGTAAAANKPGGRFGQTAVPDGSGNVWLFGGYGYNGSGAQGLLNDLWGYNFSSGQWTWKSGDNTLNSAGVYGTKGIGAAANKPGGRLWSSGLLDAAGNFWLFGGYDLANDYNDLWQFNNLTTLPIREINLKGKHRDNDNILTWETFGEENTARFTIERSANGTDFTAAGSVAAIGKGNNHYTFTDQGATGTVVYYRIQIQDQDGLTYYSNITTITYAATTSISIYPNPAANGFTLLTADNNLLNTTARLYDAAGKLVSAVLINSQKQYIDLHQLPKGVLLLQLSNGKTFTIIKK
jgi:N-acetylneuraminic acid mutarotase